MRTIAVVCGAGVATSTLIADRLREHLAAPPADGGVAPSAAGGAARATVVQATVMDLLSPEFRADVVVSTVEIPAALGIPVVSGMPLLLQTSPERTFADLDRILAQLESEQP